jgi:glucose/arabinose dehydrogenase
VNPAIRVNETFAARLRRWWRAALAIALGAAAPAAGAAPPIERVKLPPGFAISVFADGITDARSMALGDKGWLFVSTRRAGNVYAIRHDGVKALETVTIATGLNMPNGVALKDGALYVAEVSRVWRYDAIEASLPKAPQPVLVYDKYPTDRHHGWKFIRFGPDGWLYVPVGAPCNVCNREEPYASITRLKPDGSVMEIVARGVRNSVGFD